MSSLMSRIDAARDAVVRFVGRVGVLMDLARARQQGAHDAGTAETAARCIAGLWSEAARVVECVEATHNPSQEDLAQDGGALEARPFRSALDLALRCVLLANHVAETAEEAYSAQEA